MSTESLQQQETQSPQAARRQNWRQPFYNVRETQEGYDVAIHVPGVTKDGVDIHYEQGSLTVTATREPRFGEGWKALHRETPQADYRLNLEVSVPLDEDKIQAQVEDGVLTLHLPKAESVRPRKIEVK